jgi:hypothetical protein
VLGIGVEAERALDVAEIERALLENPEESEALLPILSGVKA